MIKHSKHFGIVKATGPLLPTRHLPHKTRRVDNGSVNNRARYVPKQSDRKLYQPQGHGFVPGIDAAQDQQHGTHFRGRVYKYKYREQYDVQNEVGTLQLAVTYGGVAGEISVFVQSQRQIIVRTAL